MRHNKCQQRYDCMICAEPLERGRITIMATYKSRQDTGKRWGIWIFRTSKSNEPRTATSSTQPHARRHALMCITTGDSRGTCLTVKSAYRNQHGIVYAMYLGIQWKAADPCPYLRGYPRRRQRIDGRTKSRYIWVVSPGQRQSIDSRN